MRKGICDEPSHSLAGEGGDRWWWLGELGPHGYSKPIDGPHDDRAGVEQAAYLMARLGLQRERQFVCMEIVETPIVARSHGANEAAISTLNGIGLAPAPQGPARDGSSLKTTSTTRGV